MKSSFSAAALSLCIIFSIGYLGDLFLSEPPTQYTWNSETKIYEPA
jgi:hypothetical protein